MVAVRFRSGCDSPKARPGLRLINLYTEVYGTGGHLQN
jgi:hypothetical protein